MPVRHRFSTPLEFLEEKQDYASIKALYNTKLETAALRNGRVHNGAQELPSIEIIAGVVENVLSEFPYDDSENSDAADLGFEMIVDDFPTLTHEEIEEEMEETNGGVAVLGVLAVGAGILVVKAVVGYGLYRLVRWATE